jgi:hypothetical protein
MLPLGVSALRRSPSTPTKKRTLKDILGVTSPKDRVNKRPKPADCEFQCHYPGCGKGYTQQRGYDNHVKQMHLSGNENVCKLCNRKLATAKSLEQHLENKHFKYVWDLKYGKKKEEREEKKKENTDGVQNKDTDEVSSEEGSNN